MKNYLFLLFLISLGSCTKSQLLEESPPIDENYFLNFDIHDDVYKVEEQDHFAVISDQQTESQLIFLDAKKSNRRYPSYKYMDVHEDSINIIGILNFDAQQSFGFKEKNIHFEIVVREARSNLDALTDSTYVYPSYEILYDQLSSKNFGNKNSFATDDISNIFITIPSTQTEEEGIFAYSWTSNGFYFPHEELTFTNLEFDKTENRIIAEGKFDVELKHLSCGFWSSHAITNAAFKLKIQ